jgi:hypothetical protein
VAFLFSTPPLFRSPQPPAEPKLELFVDDKEGDRITLGLVDTVAAVSSGPPSSSPCSSPSSSASAYSTSATSEGD